jgi:Arc/MetJ family transcription regulator
MMIGLGREPGHVKVLSDRTTRHRLASKPSLCRLLCRESHMTINLSLDSDLVERALEVSGERTKEEAVSLALREFIALRGQRRLVELLGKLEWDMSFDYKAERARK